MTGPSQVFTIPAGLPFADVLAGGLLERFADDPAALAGVTVLLPTRRACRAMEEAFLRRNEGAALLLPTLTPIGDIDEDDIGFDAEAGPGRADALDIPPAMPGMRRRLLLTRLILQKAAAAGDSPSPAQAARLADELARLLDQVQTERLSFDGLATLVPDDYARHWQITLAFLAIVTEHWPAMLAEQGCIDPAERRNRLIEAQIRIWRAAPPHNPVVAAGSTGTVPATADLLEAIAGLPGGEVILPGLDRALDPASIAGLAPSHPQYGMIRLLARLGLTPPDVPPWPGTGGDDGNPARAALIGHALRPAQAEPAEIERRTIEDGLAGVRRIDCPGQQEEAGVIALALRQALDTPARTAALVTPDRNLARRVAAELRRWGVEIDDSAGQNLAETPPGVFLRLVAELAATDAEPVPLLAALKHPLAAGGMAAPAFRSNVRAVERAVLRGPRPQPGFAGLRRALDGADAAAALDPWVAGLEAAAAPFAAALRRPVAPVSELIAGHVALAEALAATDGQPGADRLWAGQAGDAVRAFMAELDAAAESLAPIPGAAWPALLDTLMRGHVVRPAYGRHPRLNIWGPLEARLQDADLVVLGGLNEGTWPPDPGIDPWLSRPMRAEFGLPPAERRIGLAAHDFAQGFAAREVMLTRATRVDGTPTVPSRWLLLLDNVTAAAGLEDPMQESEARWLAWQRWLDEPAEEAPDGVQIKAPAPCPPVAARPRRLPVTQIETLIRDPYAVYARYVLGLRALEPIDADPGAADRGSIIHDALDEFLRAYPDDLPEDAQARLLEIGERAFGAALARPGVHAFWWPRFERVAAWFVERERDLRPGIAAIHSEVRGELNIAAPAGPFTLVAKADRIDERRGGRLSIIDYKTGALPRKRDITLGYSPQLALEAVMAMAGGFDGVPADSAVDLAFWRLSGGDPPGEERSLGEDAAALVETARAGLEALIAAFDDPETPYYAQPDPEYAPRFSDYRHLARLGEWTARGGGDPR